MSIFHFFCISFELENVSIRLHDANLSCIYTFVKETGHTRRICPSLNFLFIYLIIFVLKKNKQQQQLFHSLFSVSNISLCLIDSKIVMSTVFFLGFLISIKTNILNLIEKILSS
jgi:hypothetical protein